MRASIGHFVKIAFSLGFVLVGALLAATQAGATTFTYSSYLPASAPANIGIQAFMDQVQKEMEGKIKFNLYGSGTLSTGETTISAIQNGLVDGGMITSVYTPSTLLQFIDSPAKLVSERKAFLQSEVQVTIEKAEKRGVRNPQKIIDAFQKNMKKWETLIGNKEMTQRQYAEMLIANIL